jgi:hypothetical protein
VGGVTGVRNDAMLRSEHGDHAGDLLHQVEELLARHRSELVEQARL